MMISPLESSGTTLSIISSVACPAGTMNQTMRGVCNFSTSSEILYAPSAPSETISSVLAAVRFQATTRCLSRSKRRTILAPMRPHPINPISMMLTPNFKVRFTHFLHGVKRRNSIFSFHRIQKMRGNPLDSLLFLDGFLLFLDALEKLAERVGEFLYAFVLQLLRDLRVVDTNFF